MKGKITKDELVQAVRDAGYESLADAMAGRHNAHNVQVLNCYFSVYQRGSQELTYIHQ